MNDPNSVFSYYKKLIHLRHTNDVMVEGKFDVLIPEHPKIFAYTRTFNEKQLLILCNYSDKETVIPEEIQEKISKAYCILIQYYDKAEKTILRPYEAIVYEINY